MRWLFAGLAVSLLILYSPYLLYILRGRSQEFELRLQGEVAASLSHLPGSPWRFLIPVGLVALVFEAAYFVSAWMVFEHWIFRGMTLGFAFFEVIHLARIIWRLPAVTAGRAGFDTLISWPLERAGVLIFSFHAILGLLLLLPL